MNKTFSHPYWVPALTMLKMYDFARANQKTHTPPRQQQVSDHLSPEPPPESDIWGRKESDADSSAEGLIESSTGPADMRDKHPNSV